MPLVEFKNVSRVYRNGDHEQWALNHVNLSLEEGKFVVILGPRTGKEEKRGHITFSSAGFCVIIPIKDCASESAIAIGAKGMNTVYGFSVKESVVAAL